MYYYILILLYYVCGIKAGNNNIIRTKIFVMTRASIHGLSSRHARLIPKNDFQSAWLDNIYFYAALSPPPCIAAGILFFCRLVGGASSVFLSKIVRLGFVGACRCFYMATCKQKPRREMYSLVLCCFSFCFFFVLFSSVHSQRD